MVIHAFNAVLFYFLAIRLLGAAFTEKRDISASSLRLAAAIAALLFGLHPLRVEVVAWATARGYVLSGTFFLLALLAYLASTERRGQVNPKVRGGRSYLIASVVCFAVSLASVPAAVSLPLVLIILDVYPLRRLPTGGRWWTPVARRVWAEKIPFFILAAALAGSAPLMKKLEGSLSVLPLDESLAVAAYGMACAPLRTLIPVGLSPIYQLPQRIEPTEAPYVLGGLFLFVATVVLIAARRRAPAGLAVWLCYLVLMLPVSKIIHYGPLITADRYTYLSCMGFPLLATSAALWWYTNRPARFNAVAWLTAAIVVLALLVPMTRFHLAVWRDSETFFRRVVEVDPTGTDALGNLASVYLTRGEVDQAVSLYHRCLELKPRDSVAHANLGRILADRREWDAALKHLRIGLGPNPFAKDEGTRWTHLIMAITLAHKGDLAEAIEHYRASLKGNVGFAKGCSGLAAKLTETGFDKIAEQVYRHGIEHSPDSLSLLNNLAWLQATSSDPQVRNGREAVANAQRAWEQAPDKENLGLLDTMAAAWAAAGDWAKAVETADRACTLAKQSGRTDVAREICDHLELFRNRQAIGKPAEAAAQTAAAP
jgi:Flp pilus assembly protein TadD